MRSSALPAADPDTVSKMHHVSTAFAWIAAARRSRSALEYGKKYGRGDMAPHANRLATVGRN